MLPCELETLVDDIVHLRCESQHIELKRSQTEAPKRLYDTLSSFSNQKDGGIIIFGVYEHNNYSITGVDDPQAVQQQVNNQAKQMVPIVRPVFTVAEIDGKEVVSAEIAECPIMEKPCYYAGAGRLKGSYIRVGDSDEPMTEYEVYSFEAFRQNIQDEKFPALNATMDDLSSDRLTEYMLKIKRFKENLSQLSLEKVLRLQGITVNGVPTVAGLMLFGEYPQAFFPQLSITAMVIAGNMYSDISQNDERFVDNKRIEGTIIQMYESAMKFISRNTRQATIINENGERNDRPEYPLKAVRELVLNALIHRDYSIHTINSPIRILLFNNRLEIENPGGLYGRITIDELGKMSADTRNPFIAGALEVLVETENRFSGIPTIYAEMEKAHLLPPVFESQRGVFRATLYNQGSLSMNPDAANDSESSIMKKILSFCSEPRSKDEIAKHIGLSSVYYITARYLHPLLESAQLRMTLPDRPKSKHQRYVAAQSRI
ncbi:ATP-binding protein [Sphaerochaeta globosa]|uniref:Putative transcriptional regulator n=1 Tax=Sphaerochaeta globosa (strain ATCC BAA-1886 / DSM 22777 / Buddy) TaxID=158189 RepID=F0RXL4_SPHGB|nr:ATP-binding protein [Sphaerochaeta globosa]ADY12064.1 putative transcriptional regulator [Sphaerochaeta globosa str. Buddy]